MGSSPCPNSSLRQRRRKQRACPNRWRPFDVRSARVLRKHHLSRHRFSNLRNRLNPNPGNSSNHSSNHSSRAGPPNSRSKDGLNNPLSNRVGHAHKHRWFNPPSVQVSTAVVAVLDLIPTGAFARCAVNKTWGIDGWSVRHKRSLFEEDGLVKPDTWCP